MPKINVQRSIIIDAQISQVFDVINNLNHWKAWSPWLIMEPGCEVKVRDDLKYYEWNGKRIGSGNMSVTSEKENEVVLLDLVFLKPWKSKAKVRLELKAVDEGVEVTWFMESSLPFFMFWMKKMMEAFIGMDYERGLAMLKDYAEDGKVFSKLDFMGNSDFSHTYFVGIKTACSFKELDLKMKTDFVRLEQWGEQNKDLLNGKMFSIYHKWDLVNGKVLYTSALGLKNSCDKVPADFIFGEIPACKIITVRHTGAYHHLGNAWSTAYSMHRGKEFKPKRNIHPFELYVNSPNNVSDRDLITDIIFAVE
jgi:DNA gyrase inhibitor GyrI